MSICQYNIISVYKVFHFQAVEKSFIGINRRSKKFAKSTNNMYSQIKACRQVLEETTRDFYSFAKRHKIFFICIFRDVLRWYKVRSDRNCSNQCPVVCPWNRQIDFSSRSTDFVHSKCLTLTFLKILVTNGCMLILS